MEDYTIVGYCPETGKKFTYEDMRKGGSVHIKGNWLACDCHDRILVKYYPFVISTKTLNNKI